MNKRIIQLLKLAVFLGILGFVGRAVYHAWLDAQAKAETAHIALNLQSINPLYGLLAVGGFAGVMTVSGLTWRWLAWKMGDRSPTVRLLGAYLWSQMGKYIPGKVVLLLMRIERAERFGMTRGACTLSTLLENALYMISGAFVGMLAVGHIADALPESMHLAHQAIWPATVGAIAVLGAMCHPRVFYRLVGKLLKKLKRPPVAPDQQLNESTLILGVLAFVPCWFFGGLALWASTCALHPISLTSWMWFSGAFSLSVIIGMISFLPGGAGVREAVLGIAVMLQLTAGGMDHNVAVLLGALVAVVQRVCQIIAELLVGIIGGIVTQKKGIPRAGGKFLPPDGAAIGG
ncbi:MAG: lysylphosphatidylglycerol synthase domain-containing protein [Phycisphaerae bacterium]